MGKPLSVWLGFLLLFSLSGFIPPHQSQPNITVINRSGQAADSLTDGDQVRLEIRLAPSTAQAISFSLQGEETVIAAAVFGAFFINPAKFITNYWPWPLTTFDARIASSFFAGIVLWAARMKLAAHWSEVRLGVQGFMLFFGAHFLIWIFNFVMRQFDPARMFSVWVYGIVNGLIFAALAVMYWQHERS